MGAPSSDSQPGVSRASVEPRHLIGAYAPGLVPVVPASHAIQHLVLGWQLSGKAIRLATPAPGAEGPGLVSAQPESLPARGSGRALPSFPSLPAQLCPGEAPTARGQGLAAWTREEPARWCPGGYWSWGFCRPGAGRGAEVTLEPAPGRPARFIVVGAALRIIRAQGASSGEEGLHGDFP